MTTFNNIEALEKFVTEQEIVRNTNEIARIENERERVKLYNKLKELGETQLDVTQTADYIVEQDISDEWFYRKWSSGLAEMFYSKTHSLDFNTEYSGNLYVSPVINVALPFTLVEEPIFYISSASTVSENGSHSGYTEATASSIDTYAVAKTTGTKDVYVKFYVVGKWK